MSQSGATPSLPVSRDLLRLIAGDSPDWARIGACVRGPLLTVAAVVVLDVLRRHDVGLTLAVPRADPDGGLLGLHRGPPAGARERGGEHAVRAPLLRRAGAAAALFARCRAEPRWPSRPSTLVAGLLASRLHDRVRQAESPELSRADAEALSRRFSFIEQGSLILSSARQFDEIFRDLSRLIVPALADWCAIHVAAEGARSGSSPALIAIPRASSWSGRSRNTAPRALPFAAAPMAPQVVEVTEALLRESASDAEALKLYRALAPTAVLRMPLRAGDRTVGVLTLAMASDSGRRFAPADIAWRRSWRGTRAWPSTTSASGRTVQETDRRARVVFDAHPQPMWIFDVDTLAILAVNEAAVHHYGWTREEFGEMTIMDLLAPEDLAPLASAAVDHAPLRGEVARAHHQRRDGSLVDMEIVSHELELDGRRARLVLATDTTDRTRTRAALHQSEEQLRHAHRAEALGRIAGGVAHDFNNLLTTIRGFGEMLLLDMVPDDRRRSDVQRICRAADRGALLTRQLLAFGKQQAQDPRPSTSTRSCAAWSRWSSSWSGPTSGSTSGSRPGLGAVRMDPAQLEHVVVNLILGARDAMPAGGHLTIETSERRISGLTRGRPVRPGRYVVLTVGDSGDGLADEEAPRRPTVRSALRRRWGAPSCSASSGSTVGSCGCRARRGRGRLVKVYLPRLEAEVRDGLADEPDADSLRGSETVLVAEDEDGVRELLRKVLTEFGYTVLTARHGRDALMVAGDRSDAIDLLVTDVVMPEMSGRELAETLRDRQPDLKVLYISGYTDDEVVQRGVSGREVAFLRKPFASEELVRRVRGVLDAAAV